MDAKIDHYFHKATCAVDAVSPRSSSDSTLVPSRDKLKIVYDAYTQKASQNSKTVVNFVFLHGSGMNRSVWEYYLADIIDNDSGWSCGKILLIDQVNHGDSAILNRDKLGTIFDWSDGARDVCKIAMDELYPKPANTINVVVGHSMGGFQALCCGVLYPGLFQLIITIEPVVLMKNISNPENITKVPGNFYDALSLKMRDSFKNDREYNDYMDNESFYVNTQKQIREKFKDFEKMRMPDGSIKTKMDKYQHMITYLCLKPTADWLLDSIKYIVCPVVALVGGKAKWSPKENQDILQTRIRNYTKETVPGGDHLMNIEMPDTVLRKIKKHITRHVKTSVCDGCQNLLDPDRQIEFQHKYQVLIRQRVVSGSKL